MGSPFVFFLILTMLTFTDRVHSQRLYASENPLPVGSNVTLKSDKTITVGTWMFNGNTLVLFYPGGHITSINRTERMIFRNNMTSLTLTSARLTDSGLYKLEEMNQFSVELELSVQEPISNAALSAKRTDLVEFNDTAVLTCSVSTGSSLSYKWLAGNSAISSGPGVQLTNGGATLSIVGVTRYDQGPYRCNVSNGIGHDVSPPVNLTISYGPSNTTVTVMPDLYTHRSGSGITLSCSADSNPAATIQWMVNDVYLNRAGYQLDLQNVKESNSGTYKCVSYNAVTMQFSSNTAEIRVMDPLTAAVINNTGGLAIVDKMFTLRCEVIGPLGSIQWWNNGNLIAPDNRAVFGTDNKTLTLNPVQISDGGNYTCHAFNLVSNITSSPFAVEVNFGPEIPTIMGPSIVKSGNNVTLSCGARSVPPSLYRWYFNSSVVSYMSEYMTPPLTKEMSGEYICMAFNNITEKNSTAKITLRVVDPIQNVRIEALSNPAIEGNSHVLTCNITGPADDIHWMKETEPLNSDNRTVFSKDNMTVSFVTLKRSDSAQYRCLAINEVGNMTSDPYKLLVNYGPEMLFILGPNMSTTGDNVTFTCKADSAPPSLYRWYFNGSQVSNMSEYTTPPLRVEMSGEYICMAINSISGKNNTARIMFTVIDPIRNVEVKTQMNPAVEGDSFYLTCSVEGTVDRAYWMRNGEQLHPDNKTLILMDNVTIRFLSIQRNDTANYQCMAINAVGNMTSSPFILNVTYGPEMLFILGPNMSTTGDNVTFTCKADSAPPSLYRWYFNGSQVSNMSEYTTPPLRVEMSGEYICMAINSISGKNNTARIMFTVIDPIRNVEVKTQMNPAVEGDSFDLTCSVEGTVDRAYWMRNGEQLHPDNKTLILMDNVTIRFLSIQRNDTGNYQCMAINAVGNMTSSPFNFIVNYGPETPTIMGPNVVKAEDNVTLTCKAESVPPSLYRWYFNGSQVSNMSEYTTPPLKVEISGKYICMATNSISVKNNTASITFTVIDPIRNVEVKPQMNPAVEGDSFNLTCSVEGTVDRAFWIRNAEQLHLDGRTLILVGNVAIRFLSIQRNDTGNYQCMAINAVGNMTSSLFKFIVNYGPEMPTIMGPNVVKAEDSVTLRCQAESVPPSLYRWYFNGSLVSNMSEYMTPPLTKEMSGEYICMALNNITEKNSTARIRLNVIDPIHSVKIAPQMNPAKENHSFNLTCNVAGSADLIYWMKNGKLLLADSKTVFSLYNETVMLLALSRFDTGPFQCMAINAVGNMSSAKYTLSVNYKDLKKLSSAVGPETPIIYGPDFGETGRDAVFNCSATSEPPSTYTWWFNDSLVANTSEFIAGPLSFNMSGKYTCMAHNHVTGQNITNSTMLTVIEAIESVMIQSNTTPINNENITLTCQIFGPYDTIYWMKDNMQLNMNASETDSFMYNIEENMLHFIPLSINSNGTYQCVATNRAAHHRSPHYALIVNYGPFNVSISGPESAKTGASVSLTCSADSQPECDFTWFLYNRSTPLGKGSALNFSATKERAGKYLCIATHPVTNTTMEQSKMFAIADHASASYIPSKGALLLMGLYSFLAHLLFL